MVPTATNRRWVRYSVRTLLVATALVALAMSWVQRAREQRAAVAALRHANPSARVWYDYPRGEEPGPAWLRARLGVDYFATIVGAELLYPTDADMRWLARFGRLREVRLVRSVDLTDEGLTQLPALGRLEALTLDDADQVSDAGLRTLGRLSHLKRLRIDVGRRMTDEGVEQLKRALPDCRIDWNVDDEAAAQAALRGCPVTTISVATISARTFRLWEDRRRHP